MNYEDIEYIVPHGYMAGYNTVDEPPIIFEIYVNYPSKLSLEIFECIGEIELFGSNSLEHLQNKTNLSEYDVP